MLLLLFTKGGIHFGRSFHSVLEHSACSRIGGYCCRHLYVLAEPSLARNKSTEKGRVAARPFSFHFGELISFCAFIIQRTARSVHDNGRAVRDVRTGTPHTSAPPHSPHLFHVEHLVRTDRIQKRRGDCPSFLILHCMGRSPP